MLSLIANPHKTARPLRNSAAHLGAVHLVQRVAHFLHRRALRRICSDGKADSTRERCPRDMTRCVLSSIGVLVSYRAAHACVRASRILPSAPTALVRVWCGRGWLLCADKRGWVASHTNARCRQKRELPLSQHAAMTSMKRSGNPACRAVPDARKRSRQRRGSTCALVGKLLGED